MVDLKAQMAADAAAVFANLAEFGEQITYYPGAELTDARTFIAVVDRAHEVIPVRIDEGELLMLEATIEIPNNPDPLKGLTSVARDDLADVVMRHGEAPVRVRVARVLSSDPGMHVVGVVR